jgi:siroheme synthase
VRRASAVDEVVARTTLGGLVDTIRSGRIGSPAILVIGRVAGSAAELVRQHEQQPTAHPTNVGKMPAALTI